MIRTVWMACSTNCEGAPDSYIGMFSSEYAARGSSERSGLALAPVAEKRLAVEIPMRGPQNEDHTVYMLLDRFYQHTQFVLDKDAYEAKRAARASGLSKLTQEEKEALGLLDDKP